MSLWKYALHVLVFFGAYFAGVWGFAQIVGSVQNVKQRGPKLTVFTVLLHTILLGAIAFAVLHFIPQFKIALIVGYIISLVKILLAGKIE